ncbi:MAG: DUF4139 domain-containing protein [Desulfomonile tiedjei]|nr:DUF4139 domain-containing protein [Desulfomonile tiedjei]
MKVTYGLFLLIAMFALASSTAHASDPATASSAEDQIGVEVTVYNNNLGLVKDTRKIALTKGIGELRFMDVASRIMPVTVHARSASDPKNFTVLEQNYEYDLINATKLLDKYVGKKIKLIDWNKFQDRKEVVEATLLSNNEGPIYKINDEIFIGHPGTQVLPKLPENLIAKPTLTWNYENGSGDSHNLEVSYLTQDLNWKADYVVVINKDDTTADFSGWVSLDNNSGATYKNARLKLVAGEVHRVAAVAERRMMAVDRAAPAMAKAAQFEEKAFFEYHIYDLQRKTTLKDRQSKQISLLEAHGAGIQKELLVYGIKAYFSSQYREKNPKQPVNVYIKCKNSKENQLGMPLPAGVMRLYKQDESGSQQFIGEDRIQHTPKDEEIKLKIGEAFDVVAERTQTDYKQISTHLHESEWEMKIRNRKDREVTVGIVEPLFGSWQVISNTHPYKKVDARTIRFDVKVPKDQEVNVKYRVRVGI